TFNGFVNTTQDALLVFEACRTGMRKRVVRRLSDSERAIFIASKAVFAWDEAESGIKRWTDGRHWSPSRINGSFLIYREVEPCAPLAGANGRQSSRNAAAPEFVVKENGLIKKAISVTTSDGRKQHLVSYYNREDLDASRPVDCPSTSPDFSHLVLSASVYPEF
ncbi:camp independent regulatory protein, partial [Cladochytrium replicatum]